ncbi:peptidyl-tRNA hydrolase ICT1, mitochondrial isoform X1 [Astyanax mexicanus]|uniref:Large ribosomal subunit protein mL62 n=2 Tax=Astyanax mexicanus TaxID=7994 RepID=A0A8B9GXN9_ASTMX|nr:peptidyl-tRNA hydrolase ICT1, mitochondrial isoform X1 [Astyanax mexicanus]KAG9267745.1 peptidyl-tRNA hydrolase ICT1, mitochondrial isoform X1 [Astyanax mexicanus]
MAASIAACRCLHLSRSLGFMPYKSQLLAHIFTRLNHDGLLRCLNTSQHHTTKHSDIPGDQPFVIPVDQLKISYSRSSGPGGQHVNKASTKAEVRFHVQTASWIPEEVRNEIILKNKTRINKAGELIVTSEMSRSQQRNLEDCLQKITEMITEASQRPPEPSEDDIALWAKRLEKRNLARLKEKKMQSATKRGRKVDFD